ncbi:PREDICTED: uncharacterized protein LOC107089376 isoform X3 [Cyprinodon variegatus]|uniref:uncharacterized protein LOC107089376 isoform X3 n=1 Tax=Cyprinodon variegatus TaxID=28743 RepID=UPI0007427290|nr:PREDICTED: uncharacterized protein LOC107089376 isoform X3 [Cyprinodon variegatus]
MEEESSGKTSVQTEIMTENLIEENTESRPIHTPDENNKIDSGDPDEISEDQCRRSSETLAQEAMITADTQADEDYLPETHLSKVDDVNPPSVSPDPPTTKDAPSEPCWYCLRSLEAESFPKVTKQEENSDPELPLLSSGQKINYQTDPRPHFGVACSSHSTCQPLWGSEGPSWGQRTQEADQTDICPHCHLGLTPDTLRWHEAKCLLFEELRSSKKEN